jgi:hypothetical protein
VDTARVDAAAAAAHVAMSLSPLMMFTTPGGSPA